MMNEMYRAPQYDVEPAGVSDLPIAANKGLRLANYVIDQLCIVGLSFLLPFVTVLLFSRSSLDFFLAEGSAFLISLGLQTGFYLLLEGTTGRTLGKLVTGTKVVDQNGLKPSFGQIVGRTFARFIPFEAFSFLGDSGRGWHDSLAKTYVVRV